MPSFRADRRLYVTADRSEVCEEGDPRAAFLLAGEGGEIDSNDVARLDLAKRDGRVVYPGYEDKDPGAKAAPKPEDKMASAPEDKSGREPTSEDGEDATGGAEGDIFEWTLEMSPEAYLARYGDDAPNSELAQRVIEADASSG